MHIPHPPFASFSDDIVVSENALIQLHVTHSTAGLSIKKNKKKQPKIPSTCSMHPVY